MSEGQAPQKLSDLFGQGLAGWQVGHCHFLELDHTLMGQFCAVNRDGDPVIVLEKGVLRGIWGAIEKRPAKLTSFFAIAHPEMGLVFDLENCSRGNVQPFKLFSGEEVLALCQEGAVRWQHGLMQLANLPVVDPDFD